MPVEAVEIDEKEPVDLSAAKDNAWDDDDYSDSYDFDTFIAKMRHPSCKPILENVKRFLKAFYEKLPGSSVEEMATIYRSFYSVMRVKLLQSSAWQAQDVTVANKANACEGLESLLLNQLHDHVLPFNSSERRIDNELEQKMAMYGGWIQLKHFDVPSALIESLQANGEQWIATAATEFQKMAAYRTARDKVVCLLNGCKILHSLVQERSPENNMTLDDFLPVLIYSLIRANPPSLNSNLLYISRFRNPNRLRGETAYYFTNMLAAVEFIQKMDKDTLTIDPQEYEQFIIAAKETLDRNHSDSDSLDLTIESAEAKAEEFILKAREAFKSTSEKANQAFASFKESNFARNIKQFVHEMKTPKEAIDEEERLVRSLAAMDNSVATFSLTDDLAKDEEETDGVLVSQ